MKRGRLEIIRDVLMIISENRNSIKPTPLLRKSQLSSARFREYFAELLEKGLVKQVSDEKEDTYITLTEKGFSFLEKYKSIVEFIDEFEL